MRKRFSIYAFIMPVVVMISLIIFASALNHFDSGQKAQSMAQIEEAIRRGCVACYASEGFYPPDIEYLEEHYGFRLDDKYIVQYNAFADNLMPDITVLENTR